MAELHDRIIWSVEREFMGSAFWAPLAILHWPEDTEAPFDVRIGSVFRPLDKVQARALAASILRALDGPGVELTTEADSGKATS